METTNKFGLSRNIPAAIRKTIRHACGYGCVICGNAIYEYEHIDPVFAEAREHDPEKITLLCGRCHSEVTRGFRSKDHVKRAREDPYCKQQGTSQFELDIASDGHFIVKVGQTEFVNPKRIIEINGEEILAISAPERLGTPPRITAQFFDRNGIRVAHIEKNHWHGSTDAFDIEAIGGYFKIRSAERLIDLFLRVNPPNSIEIEKLELYYDNTIISGSSQDGFTVKTRNSSLKIPSKPEKVLEAPFWISVKEEKIIIGQDSVGFLNRQEHPGTYEINDADVELIDAEEFGLPFGTAKGRKVVKVTSREAGGGITIDFSNPESSPKLPDSRVQFGRKVGRNEPCPCGSGKKYKQCHGLLR